MTRYIIQKYKSNFLSLLFFFFNEKNISYCVVGDSRRLPDVVPSDIDIVISQDSYFNISNTVQEFSEKYQCQLVQILRHETTASFFVISFSTNESVVEYIHPDICSDYRRDGKLFLSANEILKGRLPALTEDGKDKCFFVPSPVVEFTYYLVKKISKGSLDKQQFEHLKEQYLIMPKACESRILEFWPKEDVELIAEALRGHDLGSLIILLPKLKKQLSKNGRISVFEHAKEIKRKLKRTLYPTGLIISFIGPDGAGKTAIGNRMQHELLSAFRGVKRYHLRPTVLGVKSVDEMKMVVDPHGEPIRGVISSLIKLTYFLADYLLGFISSIYFLKIKSHLIIFDRYFHDLLIDPVRYRYGAPKIFAVITSWFIPKPDLFIVLDAPAEVIQSRKKEVSFEETARQREAYLAFAHSQPNCIVLDTTVGIDETVKNGTQAVLDYMNARQKKRMKLK